MVTVVAGGLVAAAALFAVVFSRRRSRGKKEPPLYDLGDFESLEGGGGGGGSPGSGAGRHRRHVGASVAYDYGEPPRGAYAARPASIPFPQGSPVGWAAPRECALPRPTAESAPPMPIAHALAPPLPPPPPPIAAPEPEPREHERFPPPPLLEPSTFERFPPPPPPPTFEQFPPPPEPPRPAAPLPPPPEPPRPAASPPVEAPEPWVPPAPAAPPRPSPPPPPQAAPAPEPAETPREASFLSMSEIEVLERIGGGAFGNVHRGFFRSTEVAVKLVPALGDAAMEQSFRAEAEMLSRLRHPNVCLFMGASFEAGAPHYAIVTEYVAAGSLWDALRGEGGDAAWPRERRRFVALGVARGLAYLHAHRPPVLHRDIKSPNVLCDVGDRVKLCDVGLARSADGGGGGASASSAAAMTAGCGTPQWMAPEVLKAEPYGRAADVYAFAVVLFEVAARRCPYDDRPDLTGVALAVAVVHDGIRPTLPVGADPVLADLAAACWATDPDARPSVQSALATLEGAAA